MGSRRRLGAGGGYIVNKCSVGGGRTDVLENKNLAGRPHIDVNVKVIRTSNSMQCVVFS